MVRRSTAKSGIDSGDEQAGRWHPTAESDLTWLLHRAAQRMHAALGEQAEQHGLQLRDYIVLSALVMQTGQTQLELGRALGIDKTTLMMQLDRLEAKKLIVRRADPRDRRARIPEATVAGRTLRAKVAKACSEVEAAALGKLRSGDPRSLRAMLAELIGDGEDKGSCL
jgi:MarR family transcriptional regulator, organic hydroperoxide resistance regulator